MLKALRKSRRDVAARLHEAVVRRSREPLFFAELGVPDTLDGRFDLLTLHAALLLERLRQGGLSDLSQGLIDALFLAFDEGLRELGSGDMGMGRRMKTIADAFYGRLGAYSTAGDETSMAQAIERNLYRGSAGAGPLSAAVARYALTARDCLSRARVDLGEADFGPLPGRGGDD